MDELKRSMSRREWHDLVWSTPIEKLIEAYGLSDKALVRICERHLVPVPPKSYWAKIDAGETAKRTPLRDVENKALHTIHIGMASSRSTSQYLEEVLAEAPIEKTIEKRQRSQLLQSRLPETSSVSKVQPATPPAPDESISTKLPAKIHRDIRPFLSELRLREVDRDGFVYFKYIKVAPRDVTRIGVILSVLAFELEGHGFAFDYSTNRVGFSKAGTMVDFGIEAPRKRGTKVTEYGWKQFTYTHVGKFNLQIYGCAHGHKKQWSDGDVKRIEDSFDKIVESFQVNHVAEQEREEINRQEAASAAHMAKRQELARLRKKREEERLSYLKSIADARREASDLRATISLVSQGSDLPSDYGRMLDWAEARLRSLEAGTTVGQIQATLAAKGLYADPDPLDDPEGEPPSRPAY